MPLIPIGMLVWRQQWRYRASTDSQRHLKSPFGCTRRGFFIAMRDDGISAASGIAPPLAWTLGWTACRSLTDLQLAFLAR